MGSRKPYLSDVGDNEWPFVARYLALTREDSYPNFPDSEFMLRRIGLG